MYICALYTQCNNPDFYYIKLHALECMSFNDLLAACDYAIENIEVSESISEGQLVNTILTEMSCFIEDGMAISDLCRVIVKQFKVYSNYSLYVVRRIKV